MNRISDSIPAGKERSAMVRSLIAGHLAVNPRRVTDEARLVEDLGADWLDRLELLIAIEDEFSGLEIGEDEADRMMAVGDLIRFVESHPPG